MKKPGNFTVNGEESRELQDVYTAAENGYLKAKRAYGKSLLEGLDGPKRRARWIEAIEAEQKNYSQKYAEFAGKKGGPLLRFLRWYGGMLKPARIATTILLAGAIGTGTAFAGGMTLTAALTSFGIYRAARAGATAVGITTATEGLGWLRGKNIQKRQAEKREQIAEMLNSNNLDQAMTQVESLAEERAAYDRRTGVYKLGLAAVIGGISGVASYLHPITSGAHVAVAHHAVMPPVKPPAGGHMPPAGARPPAVAPNVHIQPGHAPVAPAPHAAPPPPPHANAGAPAHAPLHAAPPPPPHVGSGAPAHGMPDLKDVAMPRGSDLTKLLEHQFSSQSWYQSLPPGSRNYIVESYVKWFEHLPAADRLQYGLPSNLNVIQAGQVIHLHLLNNHPDLLHKFMTELAQKDPSQLKHLQWLVDHPHEIHDAGAGVAAHHAAGAPQPQISTPQGSPE
ncbi:MAG: hypothetical protein ACRD22_10395, partial [Terriglobia bacterium]